MLIRALLALTISTSVANAQGSFSCDTLITKGLREYNISSESTTYLNSVFSEYCYESGQSKSSSSNVGLEAVVKAIPLSFTAGTSDSSQAMTNFCKNFRESSDYKKNVDTYKETIVSKAYDTYAQCVQLTSLGYFVTHDLITPEKAQIVLRAGVDKPIEIEGIDVSSNIECKGPGADGNAITYTVSTHSKSNISIGVFCTRRPRSGPGGVTVFDEGSVAIAIPGYKYNFYWPKSELLPEDLASQVQSSIAQLRTGLATVAAREQIQLTTTPSPAEANNPVGGANSISQTANCPVGQMVTGVQLTLGGTCDSRCNPDGRPVSSFRLICGAAKLQTQ